MSSLKASSAGEPGKGGGRGVIMARRTVPDSAPMRTKMVAETQRGRRRGGVACAVDGGIELAKAAVCGS